LQKVQEDKEAGGRLVEIWRISNASRDKERSRRRGPPQVGEKENYCRKEEEVWQGHP